jgi:hypothetical protein
MTGMPASQPPPDLADCLFQALYSEFELRTVGIMHAAAPRGTPWFTGDSLSEVARQISSAPGRRREPHPAGPGS